MNIETFICPNSNKKIRVSTVYKIKDVESDDSVLLINRSCQHSNSDNEACQNCYGTVCHNIKKVKNKKGAAKIVKETYTDRFFIESGERFVNMMEASKKIDDMEILDILNANSILSGPNGQLGYGMWSNTWKTDCLNCKSKYSKNNELTPCQKATKHYEDAGINIKLATENQIVSHELPEECICTEQKQRIFYV